MSVPVSILRRVISAPSPADTFPGSLTFTDSLGRFGFGGVPEGTSCIFAYVDDGLGFPPVATLVAFDTVMVRRPSIPTPIVRLKLLPGGTFTGTARESGSGAPADAFVLLDGALVLTSTDSTGAYVLRGIPPGNWNVLAVELVDSVTVRRGHVSGTMPSTVRTVALPDIQIGGSPAPDAVARARIKLARMATSAAARWTSGRHQPPPLEQ